MTTDYIAQTEWEKATKDFGSASVDSMKVSVRNIYKKLDKAGAKLADDGSTQAPATPALATPASGKKRKSKSEITADGDDADATVETPKPKKKGGRPKKVFTPKATDADSMEEDDGEAVKKEANDESA